MLFVDGEEREVPLPQSSLFSIHRMSWSRLKEELDEQLRLLGFHGQHQEEDAATDGYAAPHTGASSSSYQDEGASSLYYGGTSSWIA